MFHIPAFISSWQSTHPATQLAGSAGSGRFMAIGSCVTREARLAPRQATHYLSAAYRQPLTSSPLSGGSLHQAPRRQMDTVDSLTWPGDGTDAVIRDDDLCLPPSVTVAGGPQSRQLALRPSSERLTRVHAGVEGLDCSGFDHKADRIDDRGRGSRASLDHIHLASIPGRPRFRMTTPGWARAATSSACRCRRRLDAVAPARAGRRPGRGGFAVRRRRPGRAMAPRLNASYSSRAAIGASLPHLDLAAHRRRIPRSDY